MEEIYLGNHRLNLAEKQVTGGFVELGKERFYKISNYDHMPDFFMSIVSDSNHWMYISSNGSLTAGRKNRDNSLFPYYTVDKIHDYRGLTGSKTLCLVQKGAKKHLWEPFTDQAGKVYRIERNLYKSIYCNKVIFEEHNLDLDVCFQYGWYNSDKFGWVKKSSIRNTGTANVEIEILDGVRNLLPYGLDYAFQNEYSNLLDAYKKNELLAESKVGLFMLSSIPVDRPDPSEALKATSVWSVLPYGNSRYLISDRQLDSYIAGKEITTEHDERATRGAYYINSKFSLNNKEKLEWYIIAELNQDASDVANLDRFIRTEKNIVEQIKQDIILGTQNLVKMVASADGIQNSNRELEFARHFSNTLFNIMRGGIFVGAYSQNTGDFKIYLKQCNASLAQRFAKEVYQLPKEIQHDALLKWAEKSGSRDLQRISIEYLPLTFSRRHGDPSRPWNQFSIETKNEDGTNKLNYQGNWRDIFQNWEALCISYPDYIEGIIAKFVNATTADGYNPYRISREGMDWESPDPDDPWAYIGYWGDHQIVYLLKFLEQSGAYHPGKLVSLLDKEIFVYANVPYRIRPFNELIKNPKDTIVFDTKLDAEIEELALKLGADGKLIFGKDGEIYKVSLLEKLLATLLSKLSNFIPEAGIWLNTQRPEWNDANNALVGNGVSMVTLYYIHRFLKFLENVFNMVEEEDFEISEELEALFENIFSIFQSNGSSVSSGFSNEERYHITSLLGMAGSEYREHIYAHNFSGNKQKISRDRLVNFVQLTLQYVNQSIRKNKRDDKLYHAYNLASFVKKSISIRHLYEMLEGQVAVLSSGALHAKESLEVMDALKASSLFREDQYSYVLYPDRELPRFIEKNHIPKEEVERSDLLKLFSLENDSSIITRDNAGGFHFNGKFRNAEILESALEELDTEKYGDLLKQDMQLILDIYEKIFDHQSFTGRAGTFYGYEGLGSIYWHMVSKLLLAVQECYFAGHKEGAADEVLGRIKSHYFEIKAGIGLYKSPKLYGAFPTDAYSHTPGGAGAKQPGLTGMVKEDVISRFGELGVCVTDGKISFLNSLMDYKELLSEQGVFDYIDVDGDQKSIKLGPDQLSFTVCQVPIVYALGEAEGIQVIYKDGSIKIFKGNSVNEEISSLIFLRSGDIERINYTTTS